MSMAALLFDGPAKRYPNVSITANLGHRVIAVPGLEAAIRPLRLNRRKKLQDDVDFRKPRSSFRYQADEAGSSKETGNS
jgi:hypothetical protein